MGASLPPAAVEKPLRVLSLFFAAGEPSNRLYYYVFNKRLKGQHRRNGLADLVDGDLEEGPSRTDQNRLR